MSLCDCEQTPRSCYSPGVVEDDEVLLRVIIAPRDINKDGFLAPTAIQTKDLLTRGWSLVRRGHSTLQETDNFASELAKGQSVHGVGVISAEQVRVVLDPTGQRVFCVYDDALKALKAHASALHECEQNEKALKKARAAIIPFRDVLLSAIQPVHTIEEAYAAARQSK